MIEYTYIANHTIEFRRIFDGVASDEVIATGRRSFITGWWTFSISRSAACVADVRGERVWSGDDDYVGVEKTLDFIDNYGVGK